MTLLNNLRESEMGVERVVSAALDELLMAGAVGGAVDVGSVEEGASESDVL